MSDNVAAVKERSRPGTGATARHFARATDEFEWMPAMVATIEGEKTFRGRDGMDEFFERRGDLGELGRESRRDPRDRRRVLALGHVPARGRGSGLELDQEVAYVFGFRDGWSRGGGRTSTTTRRSRRRARMERQAS